MDVDVGRAIAGKYELVRLLGRGSMGEVWVAHHKTLGEKVAVKLLTTDPLPGETEVEDPATAAARFLFEAQIAARLSRRTRHIVRVTDHGEEDGVPYLVMELLDGETLDGVLAREARVAAPTVARVVAQVARALTTAHAEGVLHRDLKPANVFLTRDEDGQLLAKLLDFGIARAIHAHRVTSAFSTAKGLVFGTPSYMSPEQARASPRLDHRCDLWALSTIAYEALTGELPVNGAETDELLANLCAGRIVPIHQRAPDLPPGLGAFFERAFAESIAERFQTAAELTRAFELALGPAARAPLAGAVGAAGAGGADAALAADGGAVVPPPGDPAGDLAAQAESLRRRARSRMMRMGGAAALAVLAGLGIAWRALAPSSSERAVGGATTTATATNPSPTPPATAPPTSPLPNATFAEPAVPVSALPRAPPRSTVAHASVPAGHGAAAPQPAAAPTAVVHAPPAAPPAPAPAPPPAPAPTKKIDKSEVL